MNVFLLLDALATALRVRLTDLPLERPVISSAPVMGTASDTGTASGTGTATESVTAKVWIATVPPALTGEPETAPFALLQARCGHETADGLQRAEVVIRLMVRDDDPETAENDLCNLTALVRRVALEARGAPLKGLYRLEADDKGRFAPWERPEQQSNPYAEARIVTHWAMQGVL